MIEIRRGDIIVASLNFRNPEPAEPRKNRPCLVLQTDALNEIDHGTYIVLPLTTNLQPGLQHLRHPVEPSKENGLERPSEVMIDQVLTIGQKRVLERIGRLEPERVAEIAQKFCRLIA